MIFIQAFLLLSSVLSSSDEDFLRSCNYSSIKPLQSQNESELIDVYWINLDRSHIRRKNMEIQFNNLNLRHHRMKGYTLDDIYVPKDVREGWWRNSFTSTSDYPPPRSNLNKSSIYWNNSIVVSGLWGRRKNNRLKELGCSVSHLLAIHKAVNDPNSRSKYALITDDDIFIPFNIDFYQMALSAPSNFAFLQLFNSNEESMENTWTQYRSRRRIWIPRYPKAAASFWSTCAYLINKDHLRPFINRLVQFREDGWIDVKLIATKSANFCDKSTPSDCCPLVINGTIVQAAKIVCSFSPKGFQADSFLYPIGGEKEVILPYVLSSPLITNGVGGNESTFHQDHVKNFHHQAFMRQRRYINEMLDGSLSPPAFARPVCSKPLPLYLQIATECSYNFHLPSRNSAPTFYDILSASEGVIQNRSQSVARTGLKYQRINPVDENDVIIPGDVSKNWATSSCVFQSKETISDLVKNLDFDRPRFIVTGLCGRGKGRDELSDLSNTITHLFAIHEAIHDNSSMSKYAIISNDDVNFAFDIDYDKLVATMDQTNWGILLLSTYDEQSLLKGFRRYSKEKLLWSDVPRNKIPEFYPNKTYIIHRRILQPILEAIFRPVASQMNLYEVKVIASVSGMCVPAEICPSFLRKSDLSDNGFGSKLSIILSNRGFTYDTFLPSLAKTFSLTMPIYRSKLNVQALSLRATLMNESSWIMTSIHSLKTAIERQKSYLNTFVSGSEITPAFMKDACGDEIK